MKAILPYLGEVDPYRGSVFYRESTNKSLLQSVTSDIKEAFPSLKDISAEWALVVTWTDLVFWEPAYYSNGQNCNCSSKFNQFQAILVKSGQRSFTILNYEKLTWAKNPWSEWVGAGYLTSNPDAQCYGVTSQENINSMGGFLYGDASRKPYTLPGSHTEAIRNLTKVSNVNSDQKGKWVFRVDQEVQGTSCSFTEPIEQIRIYPSYICHLGKINTESS